MMIKDSDTPSPEPLPPCLRDPVLQSLVTPGELAYEAFMAQAAEYRLKHNLILTPNHCDCYGYGTLRIGGLIARSVVYTYSNLERSTQPVAGTISVGVHPTEGGAELPDR